VSKQAPVFHTNPSFQDQWECRTLYWASDDFSYRGTVGNFNEFLTCEKKKIEKTHAKEKQSHAQENIYMVR